MDLINNILSGSRSAGNTASSDGKHYVTSGGGNEVSEKRTENPLTEDELAERQMQQYLSDYDKWLSNRSAATTKESDSSNLILWLLLPVAAFMAYKKFRN